LRLVLKDLLRRQQLPVRESGKELIVRTTEALTLRGLLRAAAVRNEPDAVLVTADFLEEHGEENLGRRLRRDAHPAREAYFVLVDCLDRGLIRWEDEPWHRRACATHQALEGIDPDAVPVMTRGRQAPRKRLAALLRDLLRRLAIPHVRVTIPRCFLPDGEDVARGVDVVLPFRLDAGGCEANRRAVERFRSLLAAAFPNLDNRNDAVRIRPWDGLGARGER
jgi:hypothetical protein